MINITRDGGSIADDEFSHSGLLGPLIVGGNAIYDGAVVGTVNLNSGGELQIQFNNNSTQAAVNGVMRLSLIHI